jgi:hypothetical protein
MYRWSGSFLLFAVGGLLLTACSSGPSDPSDGQIDRTFTFESGKQGWTSVFADYAPDDDTSEDGLALAFGRRPLPDAVPDGHGLFLSGRNLVDDLFMGLRRPLTDLPPNTGYNLRVEFTLASAAPSNCAGVGGTSIYLKAGGAATKPEKTLENGDYGLTIDKGNQSQGGEHARVIGTIANGVEDCHDPPYRLIERTMDTTLPVTTSDNGTLWLLVGTDSAFEGPTSLYYDSIRVVLEPQ